jgi:hypothetical protein
MRYGEVPLATPLGLSGIGVEHSYRDVTVTTLDEAALPCVS